MAQTEKMNASGAVVGVNGNMVTVEVEGAVSMNEVCYIRSEGARLKSEVIRIRGSRAQVQVFEMTRGLKIGDPVEFSGEMLAVEAFVAEMIKGIPQAEYGIAVAGAVLVLIVARLIKGSKNAPVGERDL